MALALCATGLLALLCAATAAAGKMGYVGIEGEINGAGPCSFLTVSGAEGAIGAASGVQVSSGDASSVSDDYEFMDDGKIVNWFAGGVQEANASVKLDVLERGFTTDTRVIAESPRAGVMIENPFQKGTLSNPWSHEVLAGQGIGVTVRAGSAPKNEKDGAVIDCDRAPLHPDGIDAFSIWEPTPLILGNPNGVVPSEPEVSGAIGIAAEVEYDTPVISSISSKEGPALGEQEITVEGEHLANARRPEYGLENFGTITENTNTRLKFKTPEADEREGVVEATVKPKIATFGGEATLPPADQSYTYTEVDKVPSREPDVTPITLEKLTGTSVMLSTAVNIKALLVGVCAFELEPVAGATEQEEEEVEFEEVCNPLPEPFSYAQQPISVTFENLKPGTAYYYDFFMTTKWEGRSGRYQIPFHTLTFKTLGAGEEPPKETGGKPPPQIISPVPGPSPLPGPPAIPAAALAGASSVTAAESGVFPIKLSCPSWVSSCIGSITVKTASAVRTGSALLSKATVLTLAKGAFSIPGGRTVTIRLRLSQAARRVLKRMHTLRARATIVAHDAEGATHSSVSAITIHAARPHRR